MNPLLATLSARASALARGLAAAGVGGLLLLALGLAGWRAWRTRPDGANGTSG